MILIIESPDEQVLQTIAELIRLFRVVVRKAPHAAAADTVSPEERKRRVALVRKFRGGLKMATGAKPAFGCGGVKIKMAPDFDAPLEDFKEYMA